MDYYKRGFLIHVPILSTLRLLSIVLMLMLPATIQAQYLFTTNSGKITITGYVGAGGTVVIPDTINGLEVGAIGDWTFYYNTSLTNVTIGNNVTSIGYAAFSRCYGLMSVTISTNVASLMGTFPSCSKLTDIIIPNSVTNIGDDTFNGCLRLSRITIPATVTSVGAAVFSGCTNLASISIPDSVKGVLGNGFFMDCSSLTNATLGNGITSIGDSVFISCVKLSRVSLPTSVANIGQNAFSQCYMLRDLLIPNGVTNIGSQAFSNCGLTNVVIGDNVRSIGVMAFTSCWALERVAIPDNVTSIGSSAFYGCSSLVSFRIGRKLTNISDSMFTYGSSLTNLIIPEGVTSIGEYAFKYCTGLTGVWFRGDAPFADSTAFDNDNSLTVYYYPWTTGWGSTFCGRPTQVDPAYTLWRAVYGYSGDGSDDSIDSDDDGILNWQEFLSGTVPTNKADFLVINAIDSALYYPVVIWGGKSNVVYQVRKSVDLFAWDDAPSGVDVNQQSYRTARSNQVFQYIDPDYSATTSGFYRITVVP